MSLLTAHAWLLFILAPHRREELIQASAQCIGELQPGLQVAEVLS